MASLSRAITLIVCLLAVVLPFLALSKVDVWGWIAYHESPSFVTRLESAFTCGPPNRPEILVYGRRQLAPWLPGPDAVDTWQVASSETKINGVIVQQTLHLDPRRDHANAAVVRRTGPPWINLDEVPKLRANAGL